MAIGKHVKTLLSQIPCRYIRTASSFRCSVVPVNYRNGNLYSIRYAFGTGLLAFGFASDPSRIIQGSYTAVFVEHIEVQAGMDC